MALTIHASTPAAFTATATTATSASFSPPAGALLVVAFAGNTTGGANPAAPTITDNLGAHLTYTRRVWRSRADGSPIVNGQVAIWTAPVTTGGAMTVSVSQAIAEKACKVWVITGQHASSYLGANGGAGSASSSAISQGYTAQATGGQGFLAVCDWDAKGNMTAGTGNTMDATGSVGSGQISYGFDRRTSADDTNAVSNTLAANPNGTSTNLAWGWIEILPAAFVPLSNSAAGGTDQATVTTGNSGGTSGNAWDSVTIGASATLKYEASTYVGAAPNSYSFATGVSSVTALLNWTTVVPHSRSYGRCYFACTSFAATPSILRARGAATQTFRLTVSTAGLLQLRNSANTVVSTGGVTLSTSTWYRVTWDVAVGASATGTVKIYAGNATTELETLTGSAANYGTANVDEYGFGIVVATVNHAAMWLDDMAISATGVPGPSFVAGTGADTLTMSDAVTRADALARAVADTLTAADTVARAATLPRAVADTLAAGDAATGAAAPARAVTDTLAMADSPARVFTAAGPVADSLQLADSAAAAVVAGGAEIADTLHLADSPARTFMAAGSATDALTATDTPSATTVCFRPTADVLILGDSPAASVTCARAVADTLTAFDTAARALALARPVGDALQPADDPVSSTSHTRQVADGLSAAESATRGFSQARLVADALAAAEVSAAAVAQARASADTLSAADAAEGTPGLGRTTDDTLSLSDSAVREWVSARNLADTLTGADTPTRGFGQARNITDQVSFGDTSTFAMGVGRDAIDTVGLADDAARTTATTRSTADTVTCTDAATGGVSQARTVGEPLTLADTAALATLLTRAIADQLTLAELPTVTLGQAALVYDGLTLTDAAAGFVYVPAPVVYATPHSVTDTTRRATVVDDTVHTAVSETGTRAGVADTSHPSRIIATVMPGGVRRTT